MLQKIPNQQETKSNKFPIGQSNNIKKDKPISFDNQLPARSDITPGFYDTINQDEVIFSGSFIKYKEILEDLSSENLISFENENSQIRMAQFLEIYPSAHDLFNSLVDEVKSSFPDTVEIVCENDGENMFHLIVHAHNLDGIMDKIESIRRSFYSNPNMKYFHLTTDFAIL